MVLCNVEIMRQFIGWTEDLEKELERKHCPVVEARLLPSKRSFPLSTILGKSLLSMKETVSFSVEELVFDN